jgi:hypothetical protein
MNTQELMLKNYRNMQSAAEIAKESREAFERLLKRKMLHLHSVGNSVLRKQLGSERYLSLKPGTAFSELSPYRSWLLVINPEVEFIPWKTNPQKASLTIRGLSSTGSHVAYSISASVLLQSDRDFAKQIRKDQYLAEEKLRTREIAWAKDILMKEKAREMKNKRLSKVSKNSFKGEI